jgi:solute carrier family 30 (zinc transporter), member 1
VLVASFHVVVPVGTTLNQWEKIEGRLRECMAAYGVSHLTVGPEVSIHTSEDDVGGKARSACNDLLGCSGAVVGSRELLRHRTG